MPGEVDEWPCLDNNRTALCPEHLLCTRVVQSALPTLSAINLRNTHKSDYYYLSNYAGEETEAETGELVSPRSCS